MSTACCLLATLVAAGGNPPPLKISGSDTMMAMNRRIAVAYSASLKERVIVTGGGTRLGFEGLQKGTSDIAAASREISDGELAAAHDSGRRLIRVPIALDGLAIAVPKTNPIKSLTLAQLRGIYSGKIKDWKELGGKPGRIIAFSRDKNSGTHDFFKDIVLQSVGWRSDLRIVPSTNEAMRELMWEPTGIGYGGVGYFQTQKGLRIVPIAPTANRPAVAPTEVNVRTRRYPICRFLAYYFDRANQPRVEPLLRFVRSSKGKAAIRAAGFYEVTR